MLSPVKVCEESEVATNIQLYETKQMSFTIKLYLQNDTALTNTFLTQMTLTHGVMRRFKFTVPWNIIKSKRVKVTVYYA